MVVGNKNKRGPKKEKEGRCFGRLPSFFFTPFLFVVFLCFEDSISLESLKFLIVYNGKYNTHSYTQQSAGIPMRRAEPADQGNLVRPSRGKLSGETRECIYGSIYTMINELIEKLKRIYSSAKNVYRLQKELGKTFIRESENSFPYATK